MRAPLNSHQHLNWWRCNACGEFFPQTRSGRADFDTHWQKEHAE